MSLKKSVSYTHLDVYKRQVLPFVALVYLFSRCYKKVITGLGSHQLRRDYKLREVAAGSAFGALLKKEFSRYTGSSIYLMNTAFGIVLMLGGGIYCLFASGQIGDMIAQIGLDTQAVSYTHLLLPQAV